MSMKAATGRMYSKKNNFEIEFYQNDYVYRRTYTPDTIPGVKAWDSTSVPSRSHIIRLLKGQERPAAVSNVWGVASYAALLLQFDALFLG